MNNHLAYAIVFQFRGIHSACIPRVFLHGTSPPPPAEKLATMKIFQRSERFYVLPRRGTRRGSRFWIIESTPTPFVLSARCATRANQLTRPPLVASTIIIDVNSISTDAPSIRFRQRRPGDRARASRSVRQSEFSSDLSGRETKTRARTAPRETLCARPQTRDHSI